MPNYRKRRYIWIHVVAILVLARVLSVHAPSVYDARKSSAGNVDATGRRPKFIPREGHPEDLPSLRQDVKYCIKATIHVQL